MLTGPSMSPAFTARFTWYPKLPGNRQIGRSLHFLIMCTFLAFVFMHVTMVVLTGFVQNMNHIFVGTDDANPVGLYLGLLGVGVVVLLNVFANWAAWKQPRAVQHAAKAIVSPVMGLLLDRPAPVAQFRREDVSPFFWVNGKMPTCEEWKTLAAGNFKNYRLKVYGLVENPVELSLDDLRALRQKTQITLHHCIQGWSGIAAWGGLPLAELVKLVRPKLNAKAVIFYSFSEGVAFSTGIADGQYYDSLSIENALNPQTLLAYEMNYQPSIICTEPRCGCVSRTNSASRWSSGSRRSSLSKASRRSTRAKAVTLRTRNTSANWPISDVSVETHVSQVGTTAL
jgi:sulfoxide reductase catalytic subunit YedY